MANPRKRPEGDTRNCQSCGEYDDSNWSWWRPRAWECWHVHSQFLWQVSDNQECLEKHSVELLIALKANTVEWDAAFELHSYQARMLLNRILITLLTLLWLIYFHWCDWIYSISLN
jgi:hypothetical protein